MIFDDHDVRDDWNTSQSWRERCRPPLVGGAHRRCVDLVLGVSASGQSLARRPRRRRALPAGAAPRGGRRTTVARVRPAADEEADGAKGARWSYRATWGRAPAGDRFALRSSTRQRSAHDGVRTRVRLDRATSRGDYDHLLVGTSLPWLLPRALHDVESWDERVAAGSRGARIARWAEKLRRAADLEHWASMRESFDRLADLFGDVGRGRYNREHGRAPATICVLSGDVHHAYVAAARYPHPMDSRVYQLTCSPMHNYVPVAMKLAFRLSWSVPAERAVRFVLGRFATMPPMKISWARCPVHTSATRSRHSN